MAYVTSSGRVRLRPIPSPPPTYDFEPYVATPATDGALRAQAADLMVRAIRFDIGRGGSLEDDEVREEWRADWGQRIASGTDRACVEGILAGADPGELEEMLVAAAYSAMRWAIDEAGDSFRDVMALTLAKLVSLERDEERRFIVSLRPGDVDE